MVLPLGHTTLHAHLVDKRPVNALQTKGIVQQMVETLAVLQEHGVVHCDLNPCNMVLFIDHRGLPQWKLIDFDSAARHAHAHCG